MKPLRNAPFETWRTKRFLMLDIDDTLTSEGRLTAEAYTALQAASEAGLIVIPVTGRPAGWCDMIARFWPVDAVVGENGAFSYRYDHQTRRMHRSYVQPELERAANRERLNQLAQRILAEVPGAAIASDQAFRDIDLAIDFCEDVPPLSQTAVDRIVQLFEGEGATAKISSIHVNGWFGSHDKLTTSLSLLQQAFGCSAQQARSEVVFVGDSPNDAPMFGYFVDAVGVANVVGQASRCAALPQWVCDTPSGRGFAELVQAILKARR